MPETTQAPAKSGAATWLRRVMPEGRPLPDHEWHARHRAILYVIWAHVALVTSFGIYRGFPVPQSLAEGGLILAIGLLAAWTRPGRAFREAVAALALVTSSAIIVQFSGGYIEAHFHFFVVLALVALYQAWTPFLLAIAFVALDHGVIGTLAPQLVYNHGDAYDHPWKWALIHASMVLAESAALMAAWKLAEEARNRSDLVLESAGEGILGTGVDGGIIFANPAAARLAGGHVQEMLGRPIGEFLPSIDGADHAETSFRALGRSAAIPVEIDRNPILDNGVRVGSVVTVKDIRERRRAEDSLAAAVATLSATLESTADGILVIDGTGRIAHYNQRFLEIWRMPLDVIALGEDAVALDAVEGQLRDPAAFRARVEALYANPEEESFDTLEFRDGRIVERYSRPQRVPGGAIIGRVWSFRDVTAAKRAEAAALASRVSRPLAKMMLGAVFKETKSDVSALIRLGEQIASQVSATAVPDALEAYANMGLGPIRLHQESEGRYEFRGSDLFERTERASATTCHMALGFLCGSVAKATGHPARGTETACQSRGDSACQFMIRTRPGQ